MPSSERLDIRQQNEDEYKKRSLNASANESHSPSSSFQSSSPYQCCRHSSGDTAAKGQVWRDLIGYAIGVLFILVRISVRVENGITCPAGEERGDRGRNPQCGRTCLNAAGIWQRIGIVTLIFLMLITYTVLSLAFSKFFAWMEQTHCWFPHQQVSVKQLFSTFSFPLSFQECGKRRAWTNR